MKRKLLALVLVLASVLTIGACGPECEFTGGASGTCVMPTGR